jgi:hypothetical protein
MSKFISDRLLYYFIILTRCLISDIIRKLQEIYNEDWTSCYSLTHLPSFAALSKSCIQVSILELLNSVHLNFIYLDKSFFF